MPDGDRFDFIQVFLVLQTANRAIRTIQQGDSTLRSIAQALPGNASHASGNCRTCPEPAANCCKRRAAPGYRKSGTDSPGQVEYSAPLPVYRSAYRGLPTRSTVRYNRRRNPDDTSNPTCSCYGSGDRYEFNKHLDIAMPIEAKARFYLHSRLTSSLRNFRGENSDKWASRPDALPLALMARQDEQTAMIKYVCRLADFSMNRQICIL
jgi:hypothetical protein